MMKNFTLLIFLSWSFFTNAQIINIPDANFKNALVNTSCVASGVYSSTVVGDVDTNDDGEIQVSEALAVKFLYIKDQQISSLSGIENFINLKSLQCEKNQLTSLDLQGLDSLIFIRCKYNDLTSLNVDGLTNLYHLNCEYNELTNIDLSSLSSLAVLWCQSNKLVELNLSGLTNLAAVFSTNNEIASLTVTSDMDSLRDLHCRGNNLTSVYIPSLPNLKELTLDGNQLTQLQVGYNMPELIRFDCSYNQLAGFLDLSPYTKLERADCSENSLSQLYLNNLPNLKKLECYRNHLTTLNLQDSGNLETLDCSENFLETLFLKNGSNETVNFDQNYDTLTYQPSLIYICADGFQVPNIETLANQYYWNPGFEINDLCTFVPGGMFFPFQGKNKIDTDNNGCDDNDPFYPNLKFELDFSNTTSQYIANETGYYSIPLLEGVNTVTPILDHPDYFSLDIPSVQVDFPTSVTPFIQDFCISPIGQHYDLEIKMIPTTIARPGFNASYKIVYENVGNQIQNGSLDLSFNDGQMNLLNTSTAPDSLSVGALTWNFSDLQPLETRMIFLSFKINSPGQTLPVTIGSLLNYNVSIQGNPNEVTPDNNQYQLLQTVVGAYDPNDKTCLQGNIITPDMVGEFVDYLIRFENTGNFYAENVVVKDIIDTSKFDINSLQIIDASHEARTRIQFGNQVEFIFENIQLPFANNANDGYVAFQIRTLNSLVIGDSLKNKASIYFDYNLPIITNETQTEINYPDYDEDGFNSIDDCDNFNAAINPNSIEEVYNGLDDDCNPLTLDDDLDGDGFLLADDCDDTNPNINSAQVEVVYNGEDDDCNPLTLDDDLDGDGFLLADDCDDTNPNINSAQVEVVYNGEDDDCNPLTLDDDLDGDGFVLTDDCDDTNPNINSAQVEVVYNGEDDDCNPLTLDDDLDGDGFVLADDCDDTNPNINSAQVEVVYNGEDDDCNPLTLDDDLDGDGFVLTDDCDDTNPNINSAQVEVVYNGEDDDCNPLTLDDDLDGDGFLLADDCDDTNPNINSSQVEVEYNGEDDDCNPLTLDDDLDGDGFVLTDDCDDTNPNINSAQVEVVYNGEDDDCNPLTLDDDLDGDGFVLADDCDDTNPNINSAQVEVVYNGEDDDCNPLTLDDDLDGDGFLLADDCDDTNPDVNPDQVEILGNNIDDNCNDEIDEVVSSIEPIPKDVVEIFPNPTTNILNIKTERVVSKVELFDLSGKTIQPILRNNNQIDISELKEGMYLIKIYFEAEVYFSKIIKI